MKMCMKATLKVTAGVVALIILVVVGALIVRAVVRQQNVDAVAIHTANGVSEARFVRIGDIEQWVEIRGEDRRNPVLLFLHGGPGAPLSPVVYKLLRPLEKDFTIVHWDQRGGGKTYGRNKDMPLRDLTLETLASDTIELADYLRHHLEKKKIGLLAASAGSSFGLMAAHQRPDLFFAYIGTGQLVSPKEGGPILYNSVLSGAMAAHDDKAVEELQAAANKGFDSEVVRKWYATYSPPSERTFSNQWKILAAVLTAPTYSICDVRSMIAGGEFTIKALLEPLNHYDAKAFGKTYEIPMIFLQGSEDFLTPTELVRDFMGWIDAPRKEMVIFPGGGHTAVLAMPELFADTLRTHVRPLDNRE